MTLTFPLLSQAADNNKNFAAKGLAAASCSSFVEERAKQSRPYAEAMAWLTGFISAYNYQAPDTYDVAPWQSAELLSSLLASYCKAHPKESLVVATTRLLDSIAEERLRTASVVVTISVEGQKLNIYKDMVFRIQSALKEKGYLKLRWANGDYEQSTVAAMKAFQTKNNLKATGIPDQQSLFLLFHK